MTRTKKQRTIRERVAAENEYQRACATWIGEKVGRNPDLIYGVDWYHRDGFTTESGTGFEGEHGLEYIFNGRPLTYEFWNLTPGDFVQQCTDILVRQRIARGGTP